jgi:DNA-binding LacI/PurR family transcriptional regulator
MSQSRSARKSHGMVTAQDVAREAGVSLTTVSRSFSEPELVSKRTRDRVVSVANQLGYSPNIAARVLASRRSRLIGLMVNNFDDPENLSLFQYVSAEAQKRNFHAILFNSSYDRLDSGLNSIESAMLYQVDGLLVAASRLDPAIIARCATQDKRIVIVGRKSRRPEFSSVYCDNEDGAAQVADYFFAKGVQRPAFVGGSPTASMSLERRDGFVSRIEELYGFHPIVREAGANDYAKGYAVGRLMLDLPKPPDAYFCSSDLLAIGITDAIGKIHPDKKEKLPLVVGFGRSMLSRLKAYDLASVALPMEEMVRTATSHLIDKLGEAGTGPEKIVFPCKFMTQTESN